MQAWAAQQVPVLEQSVVPLWRFLSIGYLKELNWLSSFPNVFDRSITPIGVGAAYRKLGDKVRCNRMTPFQASSKVDTKIFARPRLMEWLSPAND